MDRREGLAQEIRFALGPHNDPLKPVVMIITELRAEVERLERENEIDQRNAAQSQAEAVRLLDRLEAAEARAEEAEHNLAQAEAYIEQCKVETTALQKEVEEARNRVIVSIVGHKDLGGGEINICNSVRIYENTVGEDQALGRAMKHFNHNNPEHAVDLYQVFPTCPVEKGEG